MTYQTKQALSTYKLQLLYDHGIPQQVHTDGLLKKEDNFRPIPYPSFYKFTGNNIFKNARCAYSLLSKLK